MGESAIVRNPQEVTGRLVNSILSNSLQCFSDLDLAVRFFHKRTFVRRERSFLDENVRGLDSTREESNNRSDVVIQLRSNPIVGAAK